MASDSFRRMTTRYYRKAASRNVPTKAEDIVRAAAQVRMAPRTLRRIITRTHPLLALEPTSKVSPPAPVYVGHRSRCHARSRRREAALKAMVEAALSVGR